MSLASQIPDLIEVRVNYAQLTSFLNSLSSKIDQQNETIRLLESRVQKVENFDMDDEEVSEDEDELQKETEEDEEGQKAAFSPVAGPQSSFVSSSTSSTSSVSAGAVHSAKSGPAGPKRPSLKPEGSKMSTMWKKLKDIVTQEEFASLTGRVDQLEKNAQKSQERVENLCDMDYVQKIAEDLRHKSEKTANQLDELSTESRTARLETEKQLNAMTSELPILRQKTTHALTLVTTAAKDAKEAKELATVTQKELSMDSKRLEDEVHESLSAFKESTEELKSETRLALDEFNAKSTLFKQDLKKLDDSIRAWYIAFRVSEYELEQASTSEAQLIALFHGKPIFRSLVKQLDMKLTEKDMKKYDRSIEESRTRMETMEMELVKRAMQHEVEEVKDWLARNVEEQKLLLGKMDDVNEHSRSIRDLYDISQRKADQEYVETMAPLEDVRERFRRADEATDLAVGQVAALHDKINRMRADIDKLSVRKGNVEDLQRLYLTVESLTENVRLSGTAASGRYKCIVCSRDAPSLISPTLPVPEGSICFPPGQARPSPRKTRVETPGDRLDAYFDWIDDTHKVTASSMASTADGSQSARLRGSSTFPTPPPTAPRSAVGSSRLRGGRSPPRFRYPVRAATAELSGGMFPEISDEYKASQ
eukprot:TRINITY_DN626_c1_g1_i2.p1 TRINITY_DN626_c1_g1~~TRINITY_DN626_c1_g1_i2.p1  ORF type:complete len:681 (-),score=208.73 TRINITY_DN626_c1_g1_i2:453-2399(-)